MFLFSPRQQRLDSAPKSCKLDISHIIQGWTCRNNPASKEVTMNTPRLSAILAALALFAFLTTPAWGVSKEIVQLQTQVQALQEQMTHMQQSFDERMGVMKNLVEQSTDSMNKVASSVTDLQGSLQKQQTDTGAHVDQISGQIQALNDTLDELKARLAKVSKQLEDMQAAQQNVAAQQSQQTQQQQQQTQAPPPDVL